MIIILVLASVTLRLYHSTVPLSSSFRLEGFLRRLLLEGGSCSRTCDTVVVLPHFLALLVEDCNLRSCTTIEDHRLGDFRFDSLAILRAILRDPFTAVAHLDLVPYCAKSASDAAHRKTCALDHGCDAAEWSFDYPSALVLLDQNHGHARQSFAITRLEFQDPIPGVLRLWTAPLEVESGLAAGLVTGFP